MSRSTGLSQWTDCVSTNMPHLSTPHATVLALWSFGIAHTRTCGRLTVATFLALLLGQKVATVEQRLYDWCRGMPSKPNRPCQPVEVTTCFVPLLTWIVRLWQGTTLALTRDATSLSDRFVVLSIGVVYRGIGLPVAWTILPAGQKRAWRRAWVRMLRVLRPAIPHAWTVRVLADRGLYARWLFRRIVRLGWHPFLRINQGGTCRPDGQAQWVWFTELVGSEDAHWRGCGTAFQEHSLRCTVVAWWGAGSPEPWFVLTDVDPTACTVTWYRLRAWCEQGDTCTKRGGWQWQQTQMTDPARAERLWLALAVAMLWMVRVGTDRELEPPAETPDLSDLCPLLGTTRRMRRIRLFRLGWIWLLVQGITAQPLPLPQRLVPEPWPEPPDGWTHDILHQNDLSYVST